MAEKKKLTLDYVAETLSIPQHVLHFWIKKINCFQAVKEPNGMFIMTHRDMLLAKGLKQLLLIDGMTIRAVKAGIKEKGDEYLIAACQKAEGMVESKEKKIEEKNALSEEAAQAEASLLEVIKPKRKRIRKKLQGLTQPPTQDEEKFVENIQSVINNIINTAPSDDNIENLTENNDQHADHVQNRQHSNDKINQQTRQKVKEKSNKNMKDDPFLDKMLSQISLLQQDLNKTKDSLDTILRVFGRSGFMQNYDEVSKENGSLKE